MKTMINIKADKDIKKKAQKVAKDIGLPLSTVINAYLRQFIRDKEVHFSVGRKMSSKLERHLDKVEKDLKDGKNIIGPFSSSKEMDEHLDSL